MKTVGIIAECNPFHNGHAYLLTQAREQCNADCVVLLLSGDYTQRGEPALFDKHRRAQAALSCGADLVLELPLFAACSGADSFARGGVRTLAALGVVDAIAFGCEAEDPALLTEAAALSHAEPEEYRNRLKINLTSGLSFPAASANAILCCLGKQEDTALADALQQPNNILAIAYLRALLSLRADNRADNESTRVPEPLFVKRIGGYHADTLTPPYASASALRKFIRENPVPDARVRARLSALMPEAALAAILDANGQFYPAPGSAFSLLLHARLLSLSASHTPLAQFADVSEPLAHKIENALPDYQKAEQFVTLCLSKDFTAARIRRALLHILLDIKKTDMDRFAALGCTPYVRMLGCRKAALPLLHAIKENAALPFLTKAADAPAHLHADALALWERDIAASHLYQACMTNAYDIPFQSEYTRKIRIK